MPTPPVNPPPECPICRVLIPQLEAHILELETKLRDLQDKLEQPKPKRSVDPQPPAPAKKTTGNKRGAQPGHKPHLKKWLPLERVKEVIDHIPERCAKCDAALSPVAGTDDPPPTIHQVAELPKILAEITEHHGCYRTCLCGHVNHAPVPADVRAHSVGPNLTAAIVFHGSRPWPN